MILDWNSDFEKFDSTLKVKVKEKSYQKLFLQSPMYYPGNDLTWLTSITTDFGKDHISIINNLLNFFNEKVKQVVFYHGSCPASVNSYYEVGLKKLNIKDQQDIFLEIIEDNKDFGLTRNMGEEAIETCNEYFQKIGSYLSERVKPHLPLDYSNFQNQNFHEFLLGSEYLRTLISYLPLQLSDDKKIQLYLYKRIPTLFKILIPYNFLCQEYKEKIISNFISKWISVKFARTEHIHPGSYNFEHVPANYIVEHEHISPIYYKQCNTQVFNSYCDKCDKIYKIQVKKRNSLYPFASNHLRALF